MLHQTPAQPSREGHRHATSADGASGHGARHARRQRRSHAHLHSAGSRRSFSISTTKVTLRRRQEMTPYSQPQLDFTRKLPKVELHAHLNGSIRRSTLIELAARAGVDPAQSQIVKGDARTLSQMFAVFDVIHQSVRGADSIRRIAREVLEDAQEDGVVYYELRTTPRAHPEAQLSKAGYVEAVLAGFDDYAKATADQAVRCHASLFLSIDRRDGTEMAQDTVDLALKYRDRDVIGIDLSGDPTKGDWSQWHHALQRARDGGLKVTLHAGEVPHRDIEMQQMLDFNPDRFGHVCFLSDANLARLKAAGTPVELCLTSNILSCAATIPSYKDHHFTLHHPHQPLALCTDDSAVFGSSLSQEYAIAMATFSLTETEMIKLAKEALAASCLDRQSTRFREIEKRIDDSTS